MCRKRSWIWPSTIDQQWHVGKPMLVAVTRQEKHHLSSVQWLRFQIMLFGYGLTQVPCQTDATLGAGGCFFVSRRQKVPALLNMRFVFYP